MPHQIKLEELPVGYTLNSAKKDEAVYVSMLEFTSSEDGNQFIQKLEGFPNEILSKLPINERIMPSQIDHMLAVIYRDLSTTLYINELVMNIKTRLKKTKQAGELIFQDDIADILSLEFDDVLIPESAGFFFLFSLGWRKGFYYDLAPLHQPYQGRNYAIGNLLGLYYAYLSHQHLFNLSKLEWDRLLKQQWFPFITLKTSTVKKIISHSRNNWIIDELLDQISEEVLELSRSLIERWEVSPVFIAHLELLEKAIERYQNQDYISAVSIMYPRIEGIMRSLSIQVGMLDRITSQSLATAITNARDNEFHKYSLLLPERFRKYLLEVFFAGFTPGKPAPFSRNSLAHGVAEAKDFSLKAAVIGLLALDQIYYFLPTGDNIGNDA